jgi:uncharacterized SAM-binding protein YcdF (DUF218 family)
MNWVCNLFRRLSPFSAFLRSFSSRLYQNWRRWLFLTFLASLILTCSWSVALLWRITTYPSDTSLGQADVIIVLGASSPQVLARRTAHAVALWEEDVAPVIICTGGKTPGVRFPESDYCRRYLQRAGIPAEAIFQETVSRSTEENAIESIKIMQVNGWHTAVLVSDGYHLWRAKMIFRERFDGLGWSISTSSAQLTQDEPVRGYTRLILREVMASHWYITKRWLGLPYTNAPF